MEVRTASTHPKLPGARLWAPAISGACVLFVLIFKVVHGLHADQTFHVAALFDSLREPGLVPDLTNWNYRPLAYRVWLAVTFGAGLHQFGWSQVAARLGMVVHLALVVAMTLGAARLLESKRPRTLAVACGMLLVELSSNHWTLLSADEVSGLIMLWGLAWATHVRESTPVTRSWWRPNTGASIGLGSFALLLLLVKGISVLLVLPIGWALVGKAPIRQVGTVAAGFALFCVCTALLHVSTNEITWLLETSTLKGELRFRFNFNDLRAIKSNLYAPVLTGAGVVFTALWLFRFRQFLNLSVLALTLTTGLVVDGLQSRAWAYHASPMLFGCAFGVGLVIRTLASSGPALLFTLVFTAECAWSFATLGNAALRANGKEYASQEWHLRNLAGVRDDSETLYLTSNGRYGSYGYPFACDRPSSHVIKLIARSEIAKHRYVRSSERYLDCVLSYRGEFIIFERTWMQLRRNGYTDVISKICREYDEITPTLLKRREKGPRKNSGEFCRDLP